MDIQNVNNVDLVDEIDIVDIVANIPRHIYIRTNYFENYTDEEFIKRFRLSKLTTLFVLEQIEHGIEYMHDKNNSVSPINQLLLTLRTYATRGHLTSIGDFIHADKTTVSRIVAKVSRLIASLARNYIYMPRNEQELEKQQNDFYDIAGFPKVVGAIDGSHVKIMSHSGEDGEVFRNRKGYFSINIQAVTNANLCFQDIVARWPGSTHDSTIFNNSSIKQRFEIGDYGNAVLLGDSGYMYKPYLLTPFLNPNTPGERQYNRIHIKTRVKVKNLFGMWKRRFPIMAYGCRLKLDTTFAVIVATAVLHNIARLKGDLEPPIENEGMEQELQELIRNGDIPLHMDHDNYKLDYRRDLAEKYFSRL